jgi:hypothetical protein
MPNSDQVFTVAVATSILVGIGNLVAAENGRSPRR